MTIEYFMIETGLWSKNNRKLLQTGKLMSGNMDDCGKWNIDMSPNDFKLLRS